MKSATRHGALRWVLVPEAAAAQSGATVYLESEKLKHLRKVLRMEWGEEIRALDGRGRVFSARLEKAADRGAVRLGEVLRQEPEPLENELVICLPKNTTMDWVVEKAVECGVTHVTPVVSSRSVVRVDPNETEKYVRRWQAIMDAAVEQSERLWRPLVSAPQAWNSWVSSLPAAARKSFAFVSETRQAKTDEQALTECWQLLRSSREEPVRAMIGPEGGFSDDEREAMTRSGFNEVSLGSAVLRVETAVVSALTVLRVSRLVSAT